MADTVTDEDVATAVAEAETAQRTFLDLEHQALHAEPASRPTAAMVSAQREEAALAAQRVEVTRQRADQAREAARLAALGDLGSEVDQLAAEVGAAGTIPAAVRKLADATAELRQACAGHDEAVEALRRRAAGLLTPQTGIHGPAAANAYVTTGNGIGHKNTAVQLVGATQLSYAIHHATTGDVDAALADVAVVIDRSPPQPAAYWRDSVGQFTPAEMAQYGPAPDRGLQQMIDSGRAVRMTPAEVSAYLKGSTS